MWMRVVGLMVAAFVAVAAPKRSMPNFSGIWTLDLTKSNLCPAVEAWPTSMNIEHEGDRLWVLELVEGEEGKSIRHRRYTLDSREDAGATPVGTELVSARRVRKAIQVWYIWRSDQVGVALEQWMLSRDGKELFIKRGHGRSVQRLVFRRSTEVPE